MDSEPRRPLPHFPSRTPPNLSVIQFLTLCTHDRARLLDRPEIHALLRAAWQAAGDWLVGRYVLMPDHLHLFCAPATWPPTGLKRWVFFWRAEATRRWPAPRPERVWQRDFFDRQLRTGESYGQKWRYVVENPVRAGLVPDAAAWPYQGELNVLRWHDPA